MVGDTLRREREKQHLTIKDVEQGTSIRALYIEAIENGNYDALPGDVYTKGFIRNYANFLHIDADACVQEYSMGVLPPPEMDFTNADPEPPVANRSPRPQTQHRSVAVNKSGGSGIGFAALALVVLIGGAYFVFGFGDDKTAAKSNEHRQPSYAALDAEKSTADDVTVNQGEPARFSARTDATGTAALGGTSAPAATAAPLDKVEIVATFTGQCWTKVVADGQIVYEGTAEAGNKLTWEGKNTVAITVGNAGAIELTHNGKNIGKAGSMGQVVDKVFTKDSVN